MSELIGLGQKYQALQRNEARLMFLLNLSDALRPLDDAVEIQGAATGMLVEELKANRISHDELLSAAVVETDQRPVVGMVIIQGDKALTDFEVDLSNHLHSGKIWVQQDVVNDETLSASEKLTYAAMDIGAAVTVPMLETGELKAFFFLHYRYAYAFSEHEIELVRETAERTWFAIDAARTKGALRESEARLMAVLESVPAGIAMLDTDGRIVVANAEYRQFLPNNIMPSRDATVRQRWQAWNEHGDVLAIDDYPGARAMRGDRTVPGQEMLVSLDSGRQVWTRVACVPIYDTRGGLSGATSVVSDIDALKRGSEELRESQARAQSLIDGIATAIWETAADGIAEVDSLSWRAYTGQSYDDWKGYGWLTAIHPDDRTAIMHKWRDTVRHQCPVDAEYRLRSVDGDYRWMNVRAVPLRNERGHIVKWLGLNIDIDDRKRLEQSLRDNERRTRALIDGIPQLLWRAKHASGWTWASPQWTAFTGQSERDSLGLGWLSVIHPDERETVLTVWEATQAGAGFKVEHRLRHHDGSYRWFAIRGVPVCDEAGEIIEWLGTANDIDALREAQAGQEIMVAELQHRTRNLIAVVRALSEKTLDNASSLGDFRHRFNDRLSSLARVQSLLSRTNDGQRVTFDELLHAELSALGGSDRDGLDDRITLEGPRGIPLRSSAVQILALALHELATNAVKHGALTARTGKLQVVWSIEQGDARCPILLVEWLESGVTAPDTRTRPAVPGYGRELIERALPFQLKAKTSYAFTIDGLSCTIRVPIISTQTS